MSVIIGVLAGIVIGLLAGMGLVFYHLATAKPALPW